MHRLLKPGDNVLGSLPITGTFRMAKIRMVQESKSIVAYEVK
jgi:hypothetical protein